MRGMRPSAPTPSGRRRLASGQSPPGVGEGRGQSNSPKTGGPTPPISQPRPGALPLRSAITGGPTPEKARACAKYRSESGALPRKHKRRGALPPQRNCGEVSPPDLGTGGPTPSRQKIEGALPLSDPPPPSDPQPGSRRGTHKLPRQTVRYARGRPTTWPVGRSWQPPALRAWQVRMRTRLPPRRLRRRRSGFLFAPFGPIRGTPCRGSRFPLAVSHTLPSAGFALAPTGSPPSVSGTGRETPSGGHFSTETWPQPGMRPAFGRVAYQIPGWFPPYGSPAQGRSALSTPWPRSPLKGLWPPAGCRFAPRSPSARPCARAPRPRGPAYGLRTGALSGKARCTSHFPRPVPSDAARRKPPRPAGLRPAPPLAIGNAPRGWPIAAGSLPYGNAGLPGGSLRRRQSGADTNQTGPLRLSGERGCKSSPHRRRPSRSDSCPCAPSGEAPLRALLPLAVGDSLSPSARLRRPPVSPVF